MHFPVPRLLVFLACADAAVSAASFSLYAYGSDITPSGMKLFYADGLAYIGTSIPTFASEAANITFEITSTRIVASPESNVTWSVSPSLYIGAESGNIKTVGFVEDYTSVASGAIVSNFGFFGGYLYNRGGGSIAMDFAAVETNETGVYAIKWDTSTTVGTDGALPISLRTAAPATPSD